MEMIVSHMCRIPGSGGCWHESELRYVHRFVAVLGAAPTSAAAFDKTGAAQDAVANPIMIAPAIAVATGCFVTFFIVISFECVRGLRLRNVADRRVAAAVSRLCGGARLELEASYGTPTSECRREHFSSLSPQSL
jgi:hypothetical protein